MSRPPRPMYGTKYQDAKFYDPMYVKKTTVYLSKEERIALAKVILYAEESGVAECESKTDAIGYALIKVAQIMEKEQAVKK